MCRSFSFSVFDDRYFQNAEECNGHLFFLLLKIGCFKENKEYAGHLVFLVLMTRSFKKGKGMCWSFSFIVFIFGFYWHCILTNMVFNVFLPISNKISQSLIFAYENSHAKPRFINTALLYFWASKFIWNPWITEICRISDACSSSKFEFKTFLFKCLIV